MSIFEKPRDQGQAPIDEHLSFLGRAIEELEAGLAPMETVLHEKRKQLSEYIIKYPDDKTLHRDLKDALDPLEDTVMKTRDTLLEYKQARHTYMNDKKAGAAQSSRK